MDLSGLDSCIVRSAVPSFCNSAILQSLQPSGNGSAGKKSKKAVTQFTHINYRTERRQTHPGRKILFPLVLKTWSSNSLGQAIPKELSEIRVEFNRKEATAPIAGYQERPGAVPARIQRRGCRIHLQTPLFNSPNSDEGEKDQDSQVPSSAETRNPESLKAKTRESFTDPVAQLCESSNKSFSFKILTN